MGGARAGDRAWSRSLPPSHCCSSSNGMSPLGAQQVLWGHRLTLSIFLGDDVLSPTVRHCGEWSSPGAAAGAGAGEPRAPLSREQAWENHRLGCGAGGWQDAPCSGTRGGCDPGGIFSKKSCVRVGSTALPCGLLLICAEFLLGFPGRSRVGDQGGQHLLIRKGQEIPCPA